jgi:hypothetical protein
MPLPEDELPPIIRRPKPPPPPRIPLVRRSRGIDVRSSGWRRLDPSIAGSKPVAKRAAVRWEPLEPVALEIIPGPAT